jgi:hypothetical protein
MQDVICRSLLTDASLLSYSHLAMPAGYAGPPERLALYERVVDATPGVERKGATMPYTSRNGHMFSFLDPTGSMALRLPSDAREEFLARYGAELAVQHGRTMKEYVIVPDDLLERTTELQTWLARSHEWIGTLKPKPTTRR